MNEVEMQRAQRDRIRSEMEVTVKMMQALEAEIDGGKPGVDTKRQQLRELRQKLAELRQQMRAVMEQASQGASSGGSTSSSYGRHGYEGLGGGGASAVASMTARQLRVTSPQRTYDPSSAGQPPPASRVSPSRRLDLSPRPAAAALTASVSASAAQPPSNNGNGNMSRGSYSRVAPSPPPPQHRLNDQRQRERSRSGGSGMDGAGEADRFSHRLGQGGSSGEGHATFAPNHLAPHAQTVMAELVQQQARQKDALREEFDRLLRAMGERHQAERAEVERQSQLEFAHLREMEEARQRIETAQRQLELMKRASTPVLHNRGGANQLPPEVETLGRGAF